MQKRQDNSADWIEALAHSLKSLAKALLVEHLAQALVSIARSNMPVIAVVTCVILINTSDGTQRWHWWALITAHDASSCLSLGLRLSPSLLLRNCNSSGLVHYWLHCCATLELLKLIEHVAAIVARLTHALVEVIKSWVGHFKGFSWNCCHATQVCLITLILQDGLLSKLNPVLLFKLLDKCLQELLLCLHLFNFRFDFKRNSLLHSSLVHLVATDLSKQLHVAHRAEQETTLIEVITELSRAALFDAFLSIIFPRPE